MTAWHIVEDLPEIEASSDWVSRSAHRFFAAIRHN
jgi:hypothetical protein